MSVSIKVAVRCRPFTLDDRLGVNMIQSAEETGEVMLLNSDYTTNRFAFTYSWWSAYGFQRHVQGDPPEAESMLLIDQDAAYRACGLKIKQDLMQGNAVVLFAYGLSGSGKTFTVFGPDAVDIPEAWFKHPEPHPLWGIFPRLAYEVFNDKQDGWKITMKYFQNVVDIVRDLMSATAQEQSYKSGMRKDGDGFMDIEWCSSAVLNSWDDLRRIFQEANARKAIAPTQFNHQSTRGHCIMTLEVEMPHPEREGMKQRGRVYVCDLAGTEPAGDIVYANYKKKVFPNGDIEYKFIGAHSDARKTKELQDQGKKINLSLTEMAQFFMKMAEAIKAKKLKPGKSIPGCNSYFLCKYLKDTMLQARTYLFCAIRPEVHFHSYTFSTLGFAKNASVIKLQPKKATTAASPAERKLMQELESMKVLVEELRKQNEAMAAGGGGGEGGGGGGEQVAALQAALEAKQAALANVLAGGDEEGGGANVQEAMLQQQREEYGQHGIALSHFDGDTEHPHLVNLDEDAFRNKRFMYILDKPETKFGPNGDIRPLSLNAVADHCKILVAAEGGALTLVGGKGDTYRNGAKVNEGDQVALELHDRVVIGADLMLLKIPGAEGNDGEEPTPESAVSEYQNALQSAQGAEQAALMEQMREFEEMKAKFEADKAAAEAAGASMAEFAAQQAEMEAKQQEMAMAAVDKEILDIMPRVRDLEQIILFMNRAWLTFEVSLQRSENKSEPPKVKVKVRNENSNEEIFLDTFEFVKAQSILKDELVHLKNAAANNREYSLPDAHDPLTLLFDNSFQLGGASAYVGYLLYNFPTDDGEKIIEIKNAVTPYNGVGHLELEWEPLAGPEPEDADREPADINDEQELLGQPWTYKLKIKGASGLPVITDLAYAQYEFFGTTYTTESVEQNTSNPVWDYEEIIHIPKVTQEFIDYLKTATVVINVFVNPYCAPPPDQVSTNNETILNNLTGDGPTKPLSRADIEALQATVAALTKEREDWRAREQELLALLQAPCASCGTVSEAGAAAAAAAGSAGGESVTRSKIEEARAQDAAINVAGEAAAAGGEEGAEESKSE